MLEKKFEKIMIFWGKAFLYVFLGEHSFSGKKTVQVLRPLVVLIHLNIWLPHKNLKHPQNNYFFQNMALLLLGEQHSTGQHVGTLSKNLFLRGVSGFYDKLITFLVWYKSCDGPKKLVFKLFQLYLNPWQIIFNDLSNWMCGLVLISQLSIEGCPNTWLPKTLMAHQL